MTAPFEALLFPTYEELTKKFPHLAWSESLYLMAQEHFAALLKEHSFTVFSNSRPRNTPEQQKTLYYNFLVRESLQITCYYIAEEKKTATTSG